MVLRASAASFIESISSSAKRTSSSRRIQICAAADECTEGASQVSRLFIRAADPEGPADP